MFCAADDFEREPAGEGEFCEGFNEFINGPYPDCEEGLECNLADGFFIGGAKSVCEQPFIAHGDEYIAMSASDKLDKLWEQISSDTTSGTWAALPGLMQQEVDPTFDSPGDNFPCDSDGCRRKTIHAVGVISKVKLVVEDSPFSGIFKGADYGLIRHSNSTPYNPAKKLLKPGLSLKFLRDGVDSANTLAAFGV